MFNINENYEVDQKILKCNYMRNSPSETSTINTANSKLHVNIPREDSVISLINGCLDLKFEVIKKLKNPDLRLIVIKVWLFWIRFLSSVILD